MTLNQNWQRIKFTSSSNVTHKLGIFDLEYNTLLLLTLFQVIFRYNLLKSTRVNCEFYCDKIHGHMLLQLVSPSSQDIEGTLHLPMNYQIEQLDWSLTQIVQQNLFQLAARTAI